MSVICSSGCTSITNPQTYFDCTTVTREYGYRNFFTVRCDYQFSDITDPAEWEAAVASGDISCSPPGTLTVNAPNQTNVVIDGCGTEIVTDIEYLLDFTSYQTADDLSDLDYWKTLFQNKDVLRIGWIDCNGIFTLEDAWVEAVKGGTNTVAGENPGFEFSITQLPVDIEGEGRLTQWTTQFKIKTKNILCKTYLPGVQSVLCG